MAANVEVGKQIAAEITSLSQKEIQQLQQLLRKLPGISDSAAEFHEDVGEDLNTNFAGMILCTHVRMNDTEWILDSAATDHIHCKWKYF